MHLKMIISAPPIKINKCDIIAASHKLQTIVILCLDLYVLFSSTAIVKIINKHVEY